MPQHEALIEDLIRYCGATASTTPTPISLRTHAQRLGISTQEVQQTLEHLHALQLVSYEIREAQSGIKFLRPASRLSRDLLDWQLHEELHTESQKRLEIVTRFFTNTTDCRQQLLLNYFKDYGSTRCGICDNCRGKHQATQPVKPPEVSSVEQAVKNLLKRAPADWGTLTKQLSAQFPGLEVEPVVQGLVEKGRIEITADFELGWVG
jgi:ATP-dependent DNA helicase RecQ